jgi:hypothetical protein
VASFEVVRHTHLSADDAFARLTDWPRHAAFIPLTSIWWVGLVRDEVGARFVARTSLGPLRFDDPMEVVFWQPPVGGSPGVCRVDKRGRVVVGSTLITVTPSSEGSVAHWQEDASVRLVGRLAAWPTQLAGRRLFGRLLDGILSDEGPDPGRVAD